MWVILCHLPEKGRREAEQDSRDGREGQARKRNKTESEETEEIIKYSSSIPACCKGSRPCPTVSQYQLDALVTQDTRHFCLTQPPYKILRVNMVIRMWNKGCTMRMGIGAYPKSNAPAHQ